MFSFLQKSPPKGGTHMSGQHITVDMRHGFRLRSYFEVKHSITRIAAPDPTSWGGRIISKTVPLRTEAMPVLMKGMAGKQIESTIQPQTYDAKTEQAERLQAFKALMLGDAFNKLLQEHYDDREYDGVDVEISDDNENEMPGLEIGIISDHDSGDEEAVTPSPSNEKGMPKMTKAEIDKLKNMLNTPATKSESYNDEPYQMPHYWIPPRNSLMFIKGVLSLVEESEKTKGGPPDGYIAALYAITKYPMWKTKDKSLDTLLKKAEAKFKTFVSNERISPLDAAKILDNNKHFKRVDTEP